MKLEEIRNRIFDLAYDHESEKHITSETASIMQAIEAYIAERVIDELEKVGEAADDSYRRSGQGSRTQWSKQNETRGEAYSRSQGFKSAMLVTRRVVDTRIKELKSNERVKDNG